MLAVFFEVLPNPGHEDHYFRHVAMLKPVLAKHTDMMWLDRFKSLSRDNIILSHQLWSDDGAIARWREDEQHKGSQTAGRHTHFQDYRIRIAELIVRVEKGKLVEEFSPGGDANGAFMVVGHSAETPLQGFDESFASVNNDGAFVGLAGAGDEADARQRVANLASEPAMTWGFAARVIRDYGMFERDQVPENMTLDHRRT